MANGSDGIDGSYELEFERPLIDLERQVAELERQHGNADEIEQLRKNHGSLLAKLYNDLSPLQTVKVARHSKRPQARQYIDAFVKDFCELHGDRCFGDDHAIVTGFGRVGPHKVLVVAQHKGRDVNERLKQNFGMAHPEGYRKALLKMKLAEKFGLPVICLVDTPGAYPGIGAEERGQAEAIAVNLREMARLKTPVLAVVLGEGGSGGALGVAVADRVAMMQYAWYSVISPEACASILWKQTTPQNTEKAATALKLTAEDNLRVGVIDAVIPEPLGGAHRDPNGAAEQLERWLIQSLRELKRFKPQNLVAKRMDRLRRMGEKAQVVSS